jgi:hypothetical protein
LLWLIKNPTKAPMSSQVDLREVTVPRPCSAQQSRGKRVAKASGPGPPSFPRPLQPVVSAPRSVRGHRPGPREGRQVTEQGHRGGHGLYSRRMSAVQ